MLLVGCNSPIFKAVPSLRRSSHWSRSSQNSEDTVSACLIRTLLEFFAQKSIEDGALYKPGTAIFLLTRKRSDFARDLRGKIELTAQLVNILAVLLTHYKPFRKTVFVPAPQAAGSGVRIPVVFSARSDQEFGVIFLADPSSCTNAGASPSRMPHLQQLLVAL